MAAGSGRVADLPGIKQVIKYLFIFRDYSSVLPFTFGIPKQTMMADTAPLEYVYKLMPSPVGKIQLIAGANGLAAILWEAEDFSRIKMTPPTEDNTHPVLLQTEQQLQEYFDGQRKVFDIPLDLKGSDFQLKIWKALLDIPFGKTKSYGELARLTGDPKTVRAVGGALHRNPVSIIVPCHRVIGTSGKLVGFAGGLDNKTYLLQREGALKQPALW